jgi:hypothetical protein
MAQVGWIEVTTENGASGYLWYLKSEHETRLRFEDYLEMSMVEGEPAVAGSAVAAAGYKGTKGLFYEIANRGNVGTGAITERVDLENIIKVLDKEGAIQENVLFVNRKTSFEIDTVLAAQNNFGSSGASYGLFDNEQDMALNLGFKGFNLGYDFYKTDWKYLNDATTRGSISDIDGVLVPAGTMTVYDQVLGKNAKRPFLHTRYRKSETEDRKYKDIIHQTTDYAQKKVKNSFGQAEVRYKVKTKVIMFDEEFEAEFTLTDRSKMRNAILLGRKMIQGKFLVDVSEVNLSQKSKT